MFDDNDDVRELAFDTFYEIGDIYLKDHNERLKEDIQLNVDSEWTQMGRNNNLSLFEPFFIRQPFGMRLFIKKQTRY